MATFQEANQVRIGLKMKLSQNWWYSSSAVLTEKEGYSIIVNVRYLDNSVRKIISPVINGVNIKTEIE
jgi:hypothetical protein